MSPLMDPHPAASPGPVPPLELERCADLAAAAGPWAELAAAVETPFQRHDWLSLWWSHVGREDGVEPAVVVGRDPTGRARLLLPLGITRAGGVRRLHWLGGVLSDYGGPVVDPALAPALLGPGFPALWDRVLAVLPRVDVVHLERLLPTVAGQPSPFGALGWAPNPSASHQATVDRPWEAFYADRCSSKTRSGHRRKLRKMEKQGPVRLARVTAPAERAVVLPAAFANKSAHYRQLGVRDHFADARYQDLFSELADRPDSPVHLSALWVGEELWATHLGMVHHDTLYVLFPGYVRSEAAARCSPGAALVRWLMAEACADPALATVDFTMGDEDYKDRWCDRTTAMHDLVRATSRRGWVHAAAVDGWRQAKKRLKAHPTLYPRLLALRARLPR